MSVVTQQSSAETSVKGGAKVCMLCKPFVRVRVDTWGSAWRCGMCWNVCFQHEKAIEELAKMEKALWIVLCTLFVAIVTLVIVASVSHTSKPRLLSSLFYVRSVWYVCLCACSLIRWWCRSGQRAYRRDSDCRGDLRRVVHRILRHCQCHRFSQG